MNNRVLNPGFNKFYSPTITLGILNCTMEALLNKLGKPDLLLLPGDVNSTLAGALTAQKMEIKIGHIESGLRSYDRTMPEEINRVLVDHLSDSYFVTEPSGMEHIKKESLLGEACYVGNTMIDTLVKFSDQIDQSQIKNKPITEAWNWYITKEIILGIN